MHLKKLLSRIPSQEYISENTRWVMKKIATEEALLEGTIIIFRLSQEWFGIRTIALHEICETKIIHRIPHRSEKMLLGFVNVRGQLRICISMHAFLKIEQPEENSIKNALKFIVVQQQEEDIWVFPVDEVLGIYHIKQSQITNIPITVSQSETNLLKGIIQLEMKRVGYLDEQLLFKKLKRSFL